MRLIPLNRNRETVNGRNGGYILYFSPSSLPRFIIFITLLTIPSLLFTRSADAREIDKSEVENAVRGFVLSNSGWNSGEVTVKDIQFKGPIQVDTDDVEFETVSLKKGLFLGKTPLLVKVKVGGEVKRSFWTTPFVEVTADVPVAKGLLRNGQVIRAEDIVFYKKNLSLLSKNVILDPGEIMGKVAKMNIKSGAVVERDMLMGRKLVRRGTPVTIIAESGPLTVSATGQAEEDGEKDNFIKVLNLNSRKMIIGRVVADSTVSVHF